MATSFVGTEVDANRRTFRASQYHRSDTNEVDEDGFDHINYGHESGWNTDKLHSKDFPDLANEHRS